MITIFTPVYNRAYIIEKLYFSLLRQTNYNFEWLIVDDGSTDNIEQYIHKWIKNTKNFEIRFYHQENGGKHRAINYGVSLTKNDAFFIVDSDDYLENNTIEIISKYWNTIPTNDKFAGIAGLKKYDNGDIIGGTPHFKNFIDVTNLERKSFGLDGDKAEVYKTELLRKFPFPEYKNERFITEAIIWDKIAYEGYKIRWLNKSFMICNYLQDGLTAKGKQLFIENPKGWAHYICTKKDYRILAKEDYLKQCYDYYEWEYTKFSDNEIKKLLKLDDIEFDMIKNQYTNFLYKLLNICEDKKICIYGYGIWGKRLKRYLDYLKIPVEYILDKQFEKINEIKAYSLEMDLPQVDVVFVALNKEAEKVKEQIKNKMVDADIILCKNIVPVMW